MVYSNLILHAQEQIFHNSKHHALSNGSYGRDGYLPKLMSIFLFSFNKIILVWFEVVKCSVKRLLLFSSSVLSNSLWPHGLQHSKLRCPSLSPGACSNLCPLSQWCYLIFSSFATLFSFCLQFFPASFLWFLAFVCLLPVSWLFTSGGQSFETSASTAVFVMDIWCWIFWNWLVWYPCCLRDSQESSPAPRFKKCQFFDTQPSLCLNSHICTWLPNKNIIQLYGP